MVETSKVKYSSLEDCTCQEIASTPSDLLMMRKRQEEAINSITSDLEKNFVFYVPRADSDKPILFPKRLADIDEQSLSHHLGKYASLNSADSNTLFFPDKKLIQFVVMVSGLFTIAWYAPDIYLASPRTALHFATVLFVEMTTSLMLDHMTCQTFQWLRWQQMPLVGIVLALTYFQVDHNVISYWVTAYTWSLGAYLVMKTVLVIQECCTVLNIWCFDIVTPRTKKLT